MAASSGALFHGPTVTVKLLLAGLPAASVALVMTVVVPTGKTEPDAGLLRVARLPLNKSLALVVKVTAAPLALVAATVMLGGTLMMGAVVSRTVTVKLALPVLPAASVALAVTVVVPSGKIEPDDGLLVVASGPSISSTALVANEALAPAGPVASRVMSDGTLTTGGVLSLAATATVRVDEL